ncbi:MAG TPA: NAD(+)/NADH kinase [Desulfobulbaceae bacterium]|nr:NAD(+)/NADH kinase [Desulfobulbaceae bacterium]
MNVRHVGIITRQNSQRVQKIGGELASWLEKRSIRADVDRIEPGMDMLVILGGDGTLLHVAARAGELDIPVVGINLGDLGFLTEVAADEMYHALATILDGEIHIERRMMIKTTVLAADGTASEPMFALNETVVVKGSVERVLRLRCWADHEYIATYKADGLIFSTPTGSTAYNLSAGGPIVHAELGTLLITPICPFMLESRPVLLSPEVVLTTQLADNADDVMVMVDGRSGWKLNMEQALRVEVAEKPLLLISSPHKGYFAILRNKLNWGGNTDDVPLPDRFSLPE